MKATTLDGNLIGGTRIAKAATTSPARILTCSLLTTAGFTAVTLGVGFTSGYCIWANPAANWVLVGAGIFGTYLASRDVSWGWLLLVSLQPMWIAYALVTEQYGFVIGAMAYGLGQLNGFLRSRRGA